MTLAPAVIADLRAKFGATVTSGDLYNYDRAIFRDAAAGGLDKVRRGVFSLGGNVEAPKVTRAERASLIRERFSALDMLAQAVIAGNIGSIIVSGSAGVGKTFTLEQALKVAKRAGNIEDVVSVKGSISAIGLFQLLWQNRESGQVILIDDCDAIYGDEEAMNLLKGALDSSSVRTISWLKDSSFLRDNDIPNTFDYEGQIVFITNVNLAAVLESNNKMSPHVAALLSRAIFLDLAIHDKESIMIRIEQIVAETDFGTKTLGLPKAKVDACLSYLNENLDRLRVLSLRSMIQLAGMVKTTNEWQKLANATLLRQ